MKEGKRIVEEIRAGSEEQPQRIVIDEVIDEDFEDGLYRVVFTKMKSKGKGADITRESVWDEEDDDIVNRQDLEVLLSEDQLENIREGQVFLIRNREADDVHDKVRQHMKSRMKGILDSEGKPRKEKERGR